MAAFRPLKALGMEACQAFHPQEFFVMSCLGQRKLSLHQLRKERHIGSKSRESPPPEDERGVVDQ
eukprot:1160392-Pelagomonas_calceolata.AAC.7